MRLDHRLIYEIVEPGSRVLDLGCGEGDLLFLLAKEKKAKVQGIELNDQAIYKCVEKGLSVFHGDIDAGLSEYPGKSFDYVILNQSLQEVKKVDFVIRETMRVGKKVIIGFSNFAYIRARLRLFLKGKAPITVSLPYNWHNTPNLHFLSINDFKEFCVTEKVNVLKYYCFHRGHLVKFLPNLLATNAIFVINQ